MIVVQTIAADEAAILTGVNLPAGAVTSARVFADGLISSVTIAETAAVIVKEVASGGGDLQLVIDETTGKQKLVRLSDGTEVSI